MYDMLPQLKSIAAKYGVINLRKIEIGDEYCEANGIDYYLNRSCCAGKDEIFLGIYDDEELLLISFFHEIGHCASTMTYTGQSAYDFEVDAWECGLKIAHKEGFTFSKKSIEWAHTQVSSYLEYEERERRTEEVIMENNNNCTLYEVVISNNVSGKEDTLYFDTEQEVFDHVLREAKEKGVTEITAISEKEGAFFSYIFTNITFTVSGIYINPEYNFSNIKKPTTWGGHRNTFYTLETTRMKYNYNFYNSLDCLKFVTIHSVNGYTSVFSPPPFNPKLQITLDPGGDVLFKIAASADNCDNKIIFEVYKNRIGTPLNYFNEKRIATSTEDQDL